MLLSPSLQVNRFVYVRSNVNLSVYFCQTFSTPIGLLFIFYCYDNGIRYSSTAYMTSKQATKLEKNSKRDHLVETAFRLFKENGFYATGVDLIMREAGISKRTLYKYFPSKKELIVAVLEYYRATYQARMDSLLDYEDKTARENIRAIFDDAKTWFDDTNFHGCLAVNAMGEFSGKHQPIENACLRFKQWEIDVLRDLTDKIDTRHPEALAYKLFVLLEGMSAIAQVTNGHCPVDMTTMADEIIEQHLA